jgi:hypothetical protein
MYLVGAQLESWALHILYRLRLFVFFLSPSSKLGHDRFLSCALQIVNCPVIQPYVVLVTYCPPIERRQSNFPRPARVYYARWKHRRHSLSALTVAVSTLKLSVSPVNNRIAMAHRLNSTISSPSLRWSYYVVVKQITKMIRSKYT